MGFQLELSLTGLTLLPVSRTVGKPLHFVVIFGFHLVAIAASALMLLFILFCPIPEAVTFGRYAHSTLAAAFAANLIFAAAIGAGRRLNHAVILPAMAARGG